MEINFRTKGGLKMSEMKRKPLIINMFLIGLERIGLIN
jgi:hypothetical protein